MNKELLIKHFRAGDTGRFAKAWTPDGHGMHTVPRSWLGWLLRDDEQRGDKTPGDLIPGGIKRQGALDAEVGAFLDIVVGKDASLLGEGALPAWFGMADNASEAKARARRAVGLLDRVIPDMSRADASKLLGVYLRSNLRSPTRKAFLEQLTPERLSSWNSKSLLRAEYLLEHDGWGMGDRTDAKQAIALIDATLDHLGDVARYIRTDIVPTELLKITQSHNKSPAQIQAVAHLFTRTVDLFKPEAQQAIRNAMHTPQVDLYLNRPTPEGLVKLAGENPELSFQAKRRYESVGAATLRAYTKTLATKGADSKEATAWLAAINALGTAARLHITEQLNDAIEDAVENISDRVEKLSRVQGAAKSLPIVKALRALDPDGAMEERSWAELAVTGALCAAIEAQPGARKSPCPK